LQWLPMSEINKPEVKIPDQVALVQPNLFLGSIHGLNQFLSQGDLHTETWTGRGKLKSLKQLTREIESGECTLRAEGLASNWTIHREVNVVAIRFRLPHEADQRVLLDVGRKDAAGNTHFRGRLPGQLQNAVEQAEDVVRSICKEQFQLSDEDFVMPSEAERDYMTYSEPTDSYPGLVTTYHRLLVDVILAPEAHIMPKDFDPMESDEEVGDWVDVDLCESTDTQVSPKRMEKIFKQSIVTVPVQPDSHLESGEANEDDGAEDEEMQLQRSFSDLVRISKIS